MVLRISLKIISLSKYCTYNCLKKSTGRPSLLKYGNSLFNKSCAESGLNVNLEHSVSFSFTKDNAPNRDYTKTGVPKEMASIKTKPNASCKLGNTMTSIFS